ncbi:hypothetical protein [Methanopyrus sp.]
MDVLPADELEEWLSERLEEFVRDVGDYSIVLACAFSKRVGSGLPASDLVTALRELDPSPRRVLLLWGAGTTEVADPIEAVRAAEALHGVGEETWVGVHPTRPFHGKFLRVLPEAEGPELSIAFSWNLSRTAADSGSLESVLELRKDVGERFEEFANRLRGDGWLLGRLRRERGKLRTTLEGARELRFPCSEPREVRVRGRMNVLSGTVTVEGLVLDDGSHEVTVRLDRRLRESFRDVDTLVADVIREEFERALGDDQFGLDSDVVRYAVARAVRDVIEDLVEREDVEYEVILRAEEVVQGEETGILVDERRFPNAKAALRAVTREIVRTRLREMVENIVEDIARDTD